ncbi:MAG: VOC family protein [Candidatus Eremiobacteraeota bacterium]|nr:VOC family protein [Candidatus Eremiobacteraeota bacterium]
MHIGIARIYVNDVERAKAFYTEKLGWDVRHDQPMGPEMRWLSVAPPGAETAIVLTKGFDDWSPEKVGGSCGLALEVDDVFRVAEEFKSKGVEIIGGPAAEFFGGWARFKDSEGNEIGMHSPVPEGAKQ